MRRTLSVCLSVCPSVPFAEVVLLLLFTLQPSYERTSKIEKLPFSIIGQRQPCERVVSFVLFTFQGRIPYGGLSRTSLLNIKYNIFDFYFIPLPRRHPFSAVTLLVE